MSSSLFFSKQSRKPSGLFGRLIMSTIFDQGNAILNQFVMDLLTLEDDDHVLEIGFGTGKLLSEMAMHVNRGLVEGIDYSRTMVDMAKRRNRKYIAKGRVNLVLGDFDKVEYREDDFDKICSVNIIYFWSDPEYSLQKIMKYLRQGRKLVIGFEDKAQLGKGLINSSVFNVYDKNELIQLLMDVGFYEVEIKSKKVNSGIVHCAVAIK